MTRALTPELRDALKRLRLGPMIDTLHARIAMAEKDETAFEDLLLVVLSDEIARRQSSSATRRAHDAGLDPDMVAERWDKGAKVHYDKRVFSELCSLRFVEAKRNVVVDDAIRSGQSSSSTRRLRRSRAGGSSSMIRILSGIGVWLTKV